MNSTNLLIRISITGLNCSINIDDCESSPCQHGGTCLDKESPGFTCNCTPGFEGIKIKSIQNFHSFNEILILGLRCEKNINDCFGIPCKHGGRCTDGINNFSCDCDDDWLGNTCEIKNLCKDIDCKNSGECKYDNGNFTCHCNHPYNGPTCNMARK